MCFQLGIYVVYYLDYTIGGVWWIIILYLVQIGAVFAVRGRPHTGEAVVAELFPATGRYLRYWAAPLLSFIWNVVLPVILFVSDNYLQLKRYEFSPRITPPRRVYVIVNVCSRFVGSQYHNIQGQWLPGAIFLSSHEQRLLGCVGETTWSGDSADTDSYDTSSGYHTDMSILEQRTA